MIASRDVQFIERQEPITKFNSAEQEDSLDVSAKGGEGKEEVDRNIESGDSPKDTELNEEAQDTSGDSHDRDS